MLASRSGLGAGPIASSVALALVASAAAAQPPPPAGSAPILVTTQKREQPIEQVPLALSLSSGEQLETQHVRELTDLYRFTPGMTSAPDYSFGELTTLRGVGTELSGFGADTGLSVFVNDVYQGRSGAQVSAFYDLERVEVVKGPQAALLGRGSIAGAIRVTTRKPGRDSAGALTLSYGERNLFGLDAASNLPIGERFGMRAALHVESEDGFIRNDANGDDLRDTTVGAGRLSARYWGEIVEGTLVVSYENRDEAANVFQAQGLGLRGFHIVSEQDERDLRAESEAFDASLELVATPGLGLTITSLTGVRTAELDYAEDADGLEGVFLSSPARSAQDVDLLQQELRLLWENERGLTLSGGASVWGEQLRGAHGSFSDFGVASAGDPGSFSGEAFYESADYDGDYWGWSLFLDTTWQITREIGVTIGTRYSFDQKELAIFAPDPAGLPQNAASPNACACRSFGFYTTREVRTRDQWDDLAFRAAVSWVPEQRVALYAAWAQGWKAGGIDAFSATVPAPFAQDLYSGALALDAAGGELARFGPERSQSLELGARSSLFAGRVRLDVSSYLYEIEDHQVATHQGVARGVENVGRTEGAGIEIGASAAPLAWLSLEGGFAYGWSRIRDDDADPSEEGRAAVRAPELSAALGFELHRGASRGGELFFGGAWTYQDDFRARRGFAQRVDAYDLLDVRLGYRSRGRFSLSLFVDNVLDEFTANALAPREGFVAPVTTLSALGRPRTFGASGTVRW